VRNALHFMSPENSRIALIGDCRPQPQDLPLGLIAGVGMCADSDRKRLRAMAARQPHTCRVNEDRKSDWRRRRSPKEKDGHEKVGNTDFH